MKIFSQRDTKWKNEKMGDGTIGQYGCAVVCMSMMSEISPDILNNEIKSVNGYSGNYLIWDKLDSIKGFDFIKRVRNYNNEDVLANLPCLVEVNGAPIGGTTHWVLYIGNKKLWDPWTGTEKSTSSYSPIGYVVIKYSKPEGGIISDMEQLPKDNVLKDIRTALCGSFSEDEIKADLSSGKNLVEIITSICYGDEKFFKKWVEPKIPTDTTPVVNTPQNPPSDPTGDSTPPVETPTPPSFMSRFETWLKSIFG